MRELPIVISGMASSSIGWQELPYAALPLPLDGRRLVWRALDPLEPGGGPVLLISGLASGDDVMRGEETEVLGAARLLAGRPIAGEGIVLLPGTHSKHVHLSGGAIVGFRTFITGELFDVLANHSVLRHSVVLNAAAEPASPKTSAAFDVGVRLGAGEPLPAALFQVRSRSLLAGYAAAECRALLSGMLIAAELAALEQPAWARLPVALAAPAETSASYARAAELLGWKARLTVLAPADVARLAVVGQSIALEHMQSGGGVSA